MRGEKASKGECGKMGWTICLEFITPVIASVLANEGSLCKFLLSLAIK
jgi:hypothetical protein